MSFKLSANALKRKASVIATYNEISLSTDTDKGTQMGGAQIISLQKLALIFVFSAQKDLVL